MCNIGNDRKKTRVSKRNPLVGYRWFKVNKTNENKATLHPIAVGTKRMLWNEKVAEANKKPTLRNRNGLYAFSTKIGALEDYAGSLGDFVLGRIVAWGDCVLASNGFRAEFAKIELLYPTRSNKLEAVATTRVRETDIFGDKHSFTIHASLGQKSLRTFLRKNKNLAKVPCAKLNLTRTGHTIAYFG